MKIIRADVLGYCMGVRRAVDTVRDVLTGTQGKKVFTLGPLIHNPVVLEELRRKGLGILGDNDIDSVDENCIVIIRAHGVAPGLLERLEKKGCTVIDATCPRVKMSQRKAAEFSRQGYTVILTGDKNHGEVAGIAGFAGQNFFLVQNVQEAETLFSDEGNKKKMPHEKAVLLSQTTFSPSDFYSILSVLDKKISLLKVCNTICTATRERQDALEKLCLQVDGVLVIGGKISANTRRLFQNAQKLCKHAAFIETPEEIPSEFFSMTTVGITAGASTPDEVICAVEEKLQRGDTKKC